MDDKLTEKIVLTPKGKTGTSTTLLIERVRDIPKVSNNDVYEAGGDHRGIVVNKCVSDDVEESIAEALLRFRVFLVDGKTGDHTQEDRTLQFWFKPQVPPDEHASVAQEFFKELVQPQLFPRDYVGFIKMLMKLMQNKYPLLRKLLVELKQVEKTELPERPASTDESILEKPELSEHKVLELIESAYPNPIIIEDLAKEHGWNEEDIAGHLENLREKGLVKALDHVAFTRVIQNDTNLQIVKQMPTIVSSKQPTIAIITAQYYEKLAVDSMIDNKETFVRYTTLGGSNLTSPNGNFPTSTTVKATRFGESNVYTLGNIGNHRVVSTKLPTVGYTRDALIAAGNTTTRLLGTFQMVEYVFVVGIGGGVPHYTDYTKHVRLGDVVLSKPSLSNLHAYSHCSSVKARPDGRYEFEAKNYRPANLNIQDIAGHLKLQFEITGEAPWMKYMKEGEAELNYMDGEHSFSRPSVNTDKLYMPIGERDVIEVAHPTPQDQTDASRLEGCPKLHLGPVASGREVSRNARLREAFSREVQAVAWDFESDTVVESIVGNCRDSWAVLRGIADYRDGTKRGPWQGYASLAAASVMKAIICALYDGSPLESP